MTHTHSVAGDVFRMLGSIGCAPASLNDVSMVSFITSYWNFLKYNGIAITENMDRGKLAQSGIIVTLEYINILV